MRNSIQGVSIEVKMWAGGLLFMVLLMALLIGNQINLIAALIVGAMLAFVAYRDKVLCIFMTMAYLNFMGDIRRVVSLVAGPSPIDFLLLVAPAMAAYLAIPLFFRLKLSDTLSKSMFYLTVIMALEIFNPKQGGIAIGISGAIFYIVPMFWFWVGRRYGTPAVAERFMYSVILPIAAIAGLLGLCQTFVGFPPWEQAWIDSVKSTYTVLNLGGSIRAFGFSVSAAEYAMLLGFGAAASVGAWFGRRRAWVLAFPPLAVALFLASSRGVVVKMALAICAIYTLRKGRQLSGLTVIRLISVLAVGLFGISFVASRFATDDNGSRNNSATGTVIAHQTGGLSHPFDKKYSTAGLHSQMFAGGIMEGFAYPIGHGLGTSTPAVQKFGGGDDNYGSEIDLSDMFLDLGAIGGLLYIFIFFVVLKNTIQYTQIVAPGTSLPILGLIIGTLGSWLIGGQYSTSAVMFFLIGCITNATITHEKKQAEQIVTAPVNRRSTTRGSRAFLPAVDPETV